MSERRTVLVVANETLPGEELLEAVQRHAAAGDVFIRVIAPVNAPREGYVVYENTRRASAARRLDRTVAKLREGGLSVIGDVIDNDPLTAVRDAIAQDRPDVLIVSTHPDSKSGWRRRNLLEEVRKVARDIPVEHVTSDVADRLGARNVLVVANETVLGAPLLNRIRAKAKEAEQVAFLIVCPQSDPDRGAHPEAERRLRQALAELRAEQIEVHGQIAHPDPYTAAMHAVRDERVDEIIVSTFPEQRGSSWLRRDLVGRLRSDAKVPVEHVVVEQAPSAATERA